MYLCVLTTSMYACVRMYVYLCVYINLLLSFIDTNNFMYIYICILTTSIYVRIYMHVCILTSTVHQGHVEENGTHAPEHETR